MTSNFYQTVFSIVLPNTQKNWKKCNKNIMITKPYAKH